MPKLIPRLDILPRPQRQLWGELGQTPKRFGFVLYGGTALALRLGHRQSVDFDFFTTAPFVPSSLLSEIPYLKGATVQQSSENTLTCLVDRGGPVQVSFFGGLNLHRVEDPDVVENGIKIASLLDLAATKIKVILDRASAKDYLDIDALLQTGINPTEALGAAVAVYGPQFNPLLSLKALTYFEDGDVNMLAPNAQARLRKAAAADISRIPNFRPLRELDPEWRRS